MSEPDEARQMIAVAMAGGADRWEHYPYSVRQDRLMRADAVLATPVVAEAFRDAERLRNLAARFEGHDDWDRSFIADEIAAMLRGDGA